MVDKSSAIRQLSDEELALKVVSGSRVSFEELVSRYAFRLFNFLRLKNPNDQDTEDLVQETFFKTYQYIDRYNPEWKFSTWIFTTAARLAISHNRSTKAKKSLFLAKKPSIDPQDIVIQNEQSQNIWALARTLTKNQYQALWLCYVEDMPVKDIAKIMKKTQISVRVLLHRARLNLAKRLDQSASPERLAKTTTHEQNFYFNE